MADEDVVRGEGKQLSASRMARMLAAIERQWYQEGYDRRAHLNLARGDADTHVLQVFRHRETFRRPGTFASWLAASDIWEIEQAIRRSIQP